MGDAVISGVIVTALRRITNPRGDVLHALTRSAPGFAGFAEAYFSTALPGAVKGWKRHRRVTLNLVVPVGRIRFVLRDERQDSATRGVVMDLTLGGDDYSRLTVPPGLWVAFVGADPAPSLLLNIIDEEHDPAEADNAELGQFPFDWSTHV